jgi:non-specific serine/threonine protein kinase/serine/threonine-protein kinase
VQGKPFDRAIAEAGSYDKRLALLAPFVSACDAVAYAHRLGVIHRDIKPSNVLLGDFGDTVVIDWGLAKDLESVEPAQETAAGEAPAAAGELLTGAGALLGTPGFMSPEQAWGEPADKRSDVYALGAMLYKLLAGRPPYLGKSSAEVLAALRGGPPPPVASLVPDLAAELSTIVGRAMDPDPARRYADASELAEELKLFLTGRLVRSHSYSTWQLVRRWARRYAAVLAVSAAAVVVLVGAGVVGIRRIFAEKERANREATTARSVSGFMTGMFQVSDPGESRGNSLTAREVLDKAAQKIESNLAEDPEVRARLMLSMGTVYSNLGLYPQAVTLLDKAAVALREVLGADHPDALKARLLQAIALRRNSQLKDAEPILLDVTQRARRALGLRNPLTIDALNQLAVVLRRTGRSDQAEPIFREALENARAGLGAQSASTTAVMNNLANLYSETGRPDEARKLLVELLEIRERTLGPDHPDTITAKYNLGYAYQHEGRLDDALAVAREVREQNWRIFGPDHPDTLDSSEAISVILDSRCRPTKPRRSERRLARAS